MNLAFVFPGQGAQYAGMGKDFAEAYPVAKNIFAEADEALGCSLSRLCFEGPDDELQLTKNTQPALLTVSVAIAAVLREKGFCPTMAAGHSLGEYSALVLAEAISFSDAVRIVRRRGELMQEAVPVGKGAMAAILGLKDEMVTDVCRDLAEQGEVVEAVNFNCPGQIVIAGLTKSVELAVTRLKEKGAKRAVMLPVSAPFHSRLLLPAAQKLGEYLHNITIHDAKIPVYSNVTGEAAKNKDKIRKLLVLQAASPVLWTKLAGNMAEDGAKFFVEAGPGKTLTGFARTIAPSVPALNVSDLSSLEKTIATLKGEI
jgi:[acyl-carrier-protein] S-malonyltransferase